MSKEKKGRKYSLLVRFLGASCTFLLLGSVFYIVASGLSFVSGFLLAASITGLVGPSVVSGDGFFEMVTGVFELILEGIQTIFEVIFDTISSIFG